LRKSFDVAETYHIKSHEKNSFRRLCGYIPGTQYR
jgi:hypothetical protein